MQTSHAEQNSSSGNTEAGAIDLTEEADTSIKQEHEVIDLTANDSDERATPKRKLDDDSSAEEDEIRDVDEEVESSAEDPLSAPIQESASMTQSNEKGSHSATSLLVRLSIIFSQASYTVVTNCMYHGVKKFHCGGICHKTPMT